MFCSCLSKAYSTAIDFTRAPAEISTFTCPLSLSTVFCTKVRCLRSKISRRSFTIVGPAFPPFFDQKRLQVFETRLEKVNVPYTSFLESKANLVFSVIGRTRVAYVMPEIESI